jgi:hypothetical protein
LAVILLFVEHITWPFYAGKYPWAASPPLIDMMCQIGNWWLYASHTQTKTMWWQELLNFVASSQCNTCYSLVSK